MNNRTRDGFRGSLVFLRWIASGLLVALVWFVVYGRGGGLPPVVRAVLSVLLIFLLPGYLLQWLVAPHSRRDGPEILAISFALSLAVGTLAWGATQIVGSNLTGMSVTLSGMLTLLIVCAVFVRRQQQRSTLLSDRWQVWWSYVLAGSVALFWVFVAACWGALFMPETDNWYYLAGIRRVLQTELLMPGDPYFQRVADPGRGNPWLVLIALVTRISGTGAETIWQVAPAVLVFIAVCAHYTLGQTLFKDRLAAAFSCLFLLYGFGRFSWDMPMMIVSPAGVGFIIFVVALALLWRSIQNREGQQQILFLLMGFSLASIHILVFAGLLMALLSFAVLHWVVHRQWLYARRLLFLIAIMALLALPFISGWLSSGPQTSNPTYTDTWGLLNEFGGWHIIRPSALVGSGPSPWATAFILLPVLVVLAKRQPWALFLLSTMLFVVVTAFNPLFVESMLRLRLVPVWGIWRLALQVFQFQFVLGVLGAMALRWLWQRMGQGWTDNWLARVVLLMIALGIGFLPSSVPLVRPLWGYVSESFGRVAERATTFPFNWQNTIAFLNGEAQAGSVVLTDPNTSFFVSALSDQYVVAIPHGHSSPLVTDDEQRRQDVAQVLDPHTAMEQVRGILDRRQVDYVLLTCQSPPAGNASLSAEIYGQLVARFDSDRQHFQRVFTDESDPARQTVIFAYIPEGSEN